MEPYKRLVINYRTDKTRVYWLYGVAGSGKTTAALSLDPLAYIKAPRTKIFESYRGQATVVMDDFDESCMSLSELQDLMGDKAMLVNAKQGHTKFACKTLVIVSTESPLSFYAKEQANSMVQRQLFRAIDEVWEYTEKYDAKLNPTPKPVRKTGLTYLEERGQSLPKTLMDL